MASKDKVLGQVVNGLVDVFGFHQHISQSLDILKKLAGVD